ncbi:MAG: hypothetical protein CMQ46_05610 [Gammaproteobacteria bacterium]|nr:hypothetical protein [Gammaproteobacteria bacterium]MBJ54721.1 hypothetical protein [Gammaproteobacteria bacterium]HBN16150.1 hypothetical protein [Pseudohongiella sp.]|tara:strand:+ start:164 stop:388 length:225 start_codon:yes stop_codon:yes gene_type:complete
MINKLNTTFKSLFGGDQNLIEEDDPAAKQLQADIDAEQARIDRSRRRDYFPPGSVAPRTLKDATAPDGKFKPIV